MIEHLVRDVAGLGSAGKVFGPVLPSEQKGWTQVETTWVHIRASH